MIRQPLLAQLKQYQTKFLNEQATIAQFIEFVETNADCFERTLLIGHVTASAWILNEDESAALLIHHLKLDKWLQPGGHCDGDPDTLHVAMKECWEETGLQTLPIDTAIFDIDIHQIPARKDIPAHLHYDVRYLLQAQPGSSIAANEAETREVLWVPLKEVRNYNTEESIIRMCDKTSVYLQNR